MLRHRLPIRSGFESFFQVLYILLLPQDARLSQSIIPRLYSVLLRDLLLHFISSLTKLQYHAVLNADCRAIIADYFISVSTSSQVMLAKYNVST